MNNFLVVLDRLRENPLGFGLLAGLLVAHWLLAHRLRCNSLARNALYGLGAILTSCLLVVVVTYTARFWGPYLRPALKVGVYFGMAGLMAAVGRMVWRPQREHNSARE